MSSSSFYSPCPSPSPAGSPPGSPVTRNASSSSISATIPGIPICNKISVSQSSAHVSESLIPVHNGSGSFAAKLCSESFFEHTLGYQYNAFYHRLPDSFADYEAGGPLDIDPVSAKEPTRYNDMPCIYLTNEELDLLDKPLEFSLIAKFPAGRPKWVSLLRYFANLKLVGDYKITHYDARHVVLHFKQPADYKRIFAKPVSTILGFAVKFLKWTRDFDINHEPVVTPIWISLPNFCMSFYTRNMLLSVASAYGKPLIIDPETAKGQRPTNTRILVEMNVLKQHPKSVWMGNDEFGYSQEMVIENLPKYCAYCRKYGHTEDLCFIKDPSLNRKTDYGLHQQKMVVQKGNVTNQLMQDLQQHISASNQGKVDQLGDCHNMQQWNIAVQNMNDQILKDAALDLAGSDRSEHIRKEPSLDAVMDSVGSGSSEQIRKEPNLEGCDQASDDCLEAEQELYAGNDICQPNQQLDNSPPINNPRGSTVLNRITWEGLSLEENAGQIISTAAAKLMEECFQLMFDGAQVSGCLDGVAPVGSIASTWEPNSGLQFGVLLQSPAELKTAEGDLEDDLSGGMSKVAKNDLNWMGISDGNCHDDEDIQYDNNIEISQPPHVVNRRHSWSDEVEKEERSNQKSRKYKRKDKPQINIEEEGGMKTRSTKKGAFYYLH